jgi:hypothetical protein
MRYYAVNIDEVAVSALQDLFSVNPASNKPVAFCGLVIGQQSDEQDAQDEQLAIQVVRGNTTVGSGGSSADAVPILVNGAADAASIRVNDTTEASVGTEVILLSDCFNIRAGYQLWWPPELRPTTVNGTFMCVRLMEAPTDAITVSATLYFAETS